jgi:hypothetical protein
MLRLLISLLLAIASLPVSRRVRKRANCALAVLFLVFATVAVPIVTTRTMGKIGAIARVVFHPGHGSAGQMATRTPGNQRDEAEAKQACWALLLVCAYATRVYRRARRAQ